MDLFENLRLMFVKPQQFRGGETRHGQIPCNDPEFGLRFLQFQAFLLGSSVVPQNGRPQDFSFLIEEHSSMHLTREPYAFQTAQISFGF